MKQHIVSMYRNHNASSAALILRIALGLTFILHGWSKVTNIAGNEHFFAMIGLAAPFWSYLVAYVEFVGGILLLLGTLTKPVCVALAIDMAIVVWGLSSGRGLWWGHEFEFILILVLLAMYALGPGKYSLAHLLRKNKNAMV